MNAFLIWLSAYLIGSIPTAYWVGKYFFKIDIRNHGSKNPGATNTLRVLGKRAAFAVLIVDIFKGMVAASLPMLMGVQLNPLHVGLVAVIGHCFPIFAGFRGGKAIATTAGALIISDFDLFLVTYVTFFVVTFLSKYVFFGSISVGVAMLLYSLVLHHPVDSFIFLLFLLLLIFLHRSNIQNFRNGNEPKTNDQKIKGDRLPPKDSFHV